MSRTTPIGHRILLAVTTLALARAVMMAIKDEYFATGLMRLCARSASRDLLQGAALCVLPAAIVAAASAWLAGRRKLSASSAVLLAGLVGGYLFVSSRLPARPYYAPQFEGARALAAHGGALVAAVLAALMLAPRVRLPGSRSLSLAAILLVLAPAAGLLLWRQGRTSGDERPNLFLISLDTLRADRLGCYGYARPTSPELDRFAEGAMLFTNAYSPEPFTLTAHMSMLTSLYPSAHGVGKQRALPREVPTLASILRREGYATAAVVDVAHWMSPSFGFDRGFERYHVMPDYAEVKVDGILDLLDDMDRRPLFLFAHFYDVHSDKRQLPYEAAPEDVESFAAWYVGDFDGCNEQGECASELLFAMGDRGERLEDDEREYVSSLYDAGLRTLDRELGRLFRGLRQRGLFDDSVVLITADHGEEFFEHGMAMHRQNFDECLRVPFLLRTPGGRAGRSDELVSLVDVMPTLLSYCGARPELTQGVSLAPLVAGGQLERPREHVLIDGQAPQLGLRTRRWSLVPTRGRVAAFDLTADPLQVSEVQDADLAGLRELLEREAERMRALGARFGPGERRELSRDDLELLRALGYAGD